MPRSIPDTRGRHALLAVLDELTQAEVTERTQVPQSSLSLIKSRARLPGRETAGRLAKIGIEYGWWGEKPTREQMRREAVRHAEKDPAA